MKNRSFHKIIVISNYSYCQDNNYTFYRMVYFSIMYKIKYTLARQKTAEEQALKDTLSHNIKKFRTNRNWSQFTLAAKINISTNFLADIEAGNTWISAQTLVKLAQAFGIEAFELLKPEKEQLEHGNLHEKTISKTELSQFSQDLSIVLQENVDKAFDHVKKQYKIGDR